MRDINENWAMRRVLALLMTGKRYTSLQLGKLVGTADSRAVIRDLRARGIKITDKWTPGTKDKQRYKLYWIEENDKPAL